VHFILEAFQPWRELKANSALVHSRYFTITSSVTNVTAAGRPMSLYCSEPGSGATSVGFGAVRRGNGHKTTIGLKRGVKDQLKPSCSR